MHTLLRGASCSQKSLIQLSLSFRPLRLRRLAHCSPAVQELGSFLYLVSSMANSPQSRRFALPGPPSLRRWDHGKDDCSCGASSIYGVSCLWSICISLVVTAECSFESVHVYCHTPTNVLIVSTVLLRYFQQLFLARHFVTI